jgi:hypothetical protein
MPRRRVIIPGRGPFQDRTGDGHTQRQRHEKVASPAEPPALCPNLPGMKVDDLARDGKTDAESRVRCKPRRCRLTERLKNLLDEIRCDADTAVSDAHLRLKRSAFRPYLDGPGRRVLHGVGEKVHDNLFEARAVANDPQRIGR